MTGTVALALLLAATEKTVVFSLTVPQDQVALRKAIGAIGGVTGVGIDSGKGELAVRVTAGQERAVEKALKARGLVAQSLPVRTQVDGPDTLLLTPDGSGVGPLDALRVPGKYTVFDVFAEWCEPCTLVDEELRRILEKRTDVAVRRLNVVSFESPLARELDLEALPRVVVYSPGGRRTDIDGADLDALQDSLRGP